MLLTGPLLTTTAPNFQAGIRKTIEIELSEFNDAIDELLDIESETHKPKLKLLGRVKRLAREGLITSMRSKYILNLVPNQSNILRQSLKQATQYRLRLVQGDALPSQPENPVNSIYHAAFQMQVR